MGIDIDTAVAAFDSADRIFDSTQVGDAIDALADAIASDLAGHNPLILCIMNGGLILSGKLLPRLNFPLRVDYLHATRYRGATRGRQLRWERTPSESLDGERVLLIDDILDEGETLAGIIDFCRDAGAASVSSAVLVRKLHDRCNDVVVDYIGLEAPDRYLFGYGMDYKGFWRNADGIFAVAPEYE